MNCRGSGGSGAGLARSGCGCTRCCCLLLLRWACSALIQEPEDSVPEHCEAVLNEGDGRCLALGNGPVDLGFVLGEVRRYVLLVDP
jgi:hypothetical protein